MTFALAGTVSRLTKPGHYSHLKADALFRGDSTAFGMLSAFFEDDRLSDQRLRQHYSLPVSQDSHRHQAGPAGVLEEIQAVPACYARFVKAHEAPVTGEGAETISVPGDVANTLTPQKVTRLASEGMNLTVYLRPDNENPARGATAYGGENDYFENYRLPSIIARDGYVFAFTDGKHMPDPNHFMRGERSYFCYSNVRDLFIHFAPRFTGKALPSVSAQLMAQSRYSGLERIMRAPLTCVFDTSHPRVDEAELKALIRKGAKIRISMLDEMDT